MRNKKAQGLSINVIIVAIIALIILVVLVAIFTGRLGIFSRTAGEFGSCESFGGSCQVNPCDPTDEERVIAANNCGRDNPDNPNNNRDKDAPYCCKQKLQN